MNKIGIVVPLYNQGQYLDECINSVLSSDFTNVKIVIVDDGSTDNSGEIADRQLKKSPKIEVIHHSENMGLPAARNSGICALDTYYILPLDADDVLFPGALRKFFKTMELFRCGIAYCGYQMFGDKSGVRLPQAYSFEALKRGNFITACSMFKRDDWERVGGYNETLTSGLEDWAFWLKLGSIGVKGFQIKEPLFRYRMKPISMITETKKKHDEVFGQLRQSLPEVYGVNGVI